MNISDLEVFLKSGTVLSLEKGRCLVGWGERRWTQKPETQDGPAFFFPDYFLSHENPWFTHAHDAEMELSELKELLEARVPHKEHPLEWKNDHHDFFVEAFEDLQKRFLDGEMKKAVPFVLEKAAIGMNANRLHHCLIHLLQYSQSQPVHIYGFWDEKEGMLGATPEILFRMEDQKLETVACAGTCPIADVDEFLTDKKQLLEHQLVVDGIRESLDPLGTVSPGDVEVLKLPKLCHLVTPIDVNLNQAVTFEAIVRALHPTPALGAFPKESGVEWLKQYQTKINRKRFGAPVGYVGKGGHRSACFVAIRNAQWEGNEIAIGAGCGIVPQSELDAEWDEIKLKIQSVKDILHL